MEKMKVAILDFYDGNSSDSISNIKEIVKNVSKMNNIDVEINSFEVRTKNEIPKLSFDVYFSSGGPGSPFADAGKNWETNYFNFLEQLYSYNQKNDDKKFLFGICYSFQLMSRFFDFGKVTKREFESFGAVKINKTESGKYEPILQGLPLTFFAVDNRNWQVIEPNNPKLAEVNAKILAIEKSEKVLSHRAMMAIKVENEIFMTQFHPERDYGYLLLKFSEEKIKNAIIANFGKEKFDEMQSVLGKDKPINLTYKTVIPNFLQIVINKLKEK